MRGLSVSLITGMLLACTSAAQARPATAVQDFAGGGPLASVPGVLQCVPFARDTSGIRLYGDAHTWWGQAAGKYARGRSPKPGAVLAIRPHGNSTLGHVATVRRVIDTRTILIDHANWSSPGKIERNVTAVDVSPANDWSEVRVWFAPIQNLGVSHWPVAGFIYNAQPGKEPKASKLAAAAPVSSTKVREPTRSAVRSKSAQGRMRIAKVDPGKDPIGAILAGSY
jgi:surface antigen